MPNTNNVRIELQDIGLPTSKDNTLSGTALEAWSDLCHEGLKKMGYHMQAKDLVSHLRQAGYVDVREEPYTWPLNSWPKDPHLKALGHLNSLNLLRGLEADSLKPLLHLGLKTKHIHKSIEKVTTNVCASSIHCFWPV